MAKTEDSKIDWGKAQELLKSTSDKARDERLNAPSEHSATLKGITSKRLDRNVSDDWSSLRTPVIERTLNELGLPEEVASLRVLQERDALHGLAARAHRTCQFAELARLEKTILKDDKVPTGTQTTLLNQIDKARGKVAEEYNKAIQSSPEAFMAAHSADFTAYRRQYTRGRIIETHYVKDKINEIIPHLRNTRLCFISGETGTGKTEVARICARNATGKPPLVVRGYAGMGSTELFGHMTLTDNWEKRAENTAVQIEQAHEKYKEKHPKYTDKDLEDITKRLLQDSSTTTTEYILGSVYLAAEEGRVVIIDEANYIPPELLAKLNDVMTKDPAKKEKVDVQEDGVGPITVQEGFGIIFTGNVNPPSGPRAQRYIGRVAFDAAFMDRVPVVDYNRLPQAISGEPKDYNPEDKQVFLLAVVSALLPPDRTNPIAALEKVEERYSSLFLPGGAKGGLDALWRFSQFAAITQSAFEGKIKDGDAFAFDRGTGSITGYTPALQLSNRGMMRVIEEWRDNGYRYELDYYLAKDLFNRAQKPQDRAYLYQIGQKFGFFKTDGWEQQPDYTNDSLDTFTVKIPMQRGADDVLRPNPTAGRVQVPAEKVIESVFGQIPDRTEWPDGVQTEAEQNQDQAFEFGAIEDELNNLFNSMSSDQENIALKETAEFDADAEDYREKVINPRLKDLRAQLQELKEKA